MSPTSDPSTSSRAPARHASEPGLAILLLATFVISLLSLPAFRYDGDVFAWEMEAEGLVHRGRLDVRPSIPESLPANAPFFLFNRETGRWHSKYGIGNTLIYAIPLAVERTLLGVRDVDPPTTIFGKPEGGYTGTRRLGLFNAFNLLLTLWLAGTLYRLARLHTERPSTAVVFALACLYASYLWNYTRAHSSQIYQVLFFSLAVLHFTRFVRAPDHQQGRSLLCGVLALCALCTVKTVFLPLLAVFGVAVLLTGQAPGEPLARGLAEGVRRNIGLYAKQALVPVLGLVVLLAVANHIKFGAAWAMGYEREPTLWTGRLSDSIPAYLFGPRFSIFVHFPPLCLALFGLRQIWKERRFEFLTVAIGFALMFFIYANYQFWRGEASYGTRYLLFGLPALALPAVYALDALRDAAKAPLRAAGFAALGVATAIAVYAQVQVNRLEFHTFFRLRHQFHALTTRDPVMNRYLLDTNTAVFHRDFLRYRDGGPTPLPLLRLEQQLPPARYERLVESIPSYLGSNHLFFE